jgi:NhaP-type Na+/H+ or K+/H+ antiporter
MLLSVALILLIGVVVIFYMRKLPLPGLLGLLLLGVALGHQGFNLLAPELLALGADLRLMALMIILLRTGLGLNRRVLNQVRSQALGLGFLPCICQDVVVAAASNLILGFTWPTAFSVGFVLAAVSPAVVVPSMLWLKERGLRTNKGIPTMLLAGASVDDMVAITFLTSALAWGIGSAGAMGWQIAHFPLRILGGIALDLGAGWLSLKLLPPINRLNKGYGVITIFGLALLVEPPGGGGRVVMKRRKTMRAKDVMSRNVITVFPDISVGEAL